MLARWLFNRSAYLPCRLINRDDGKPYLERYYVGRLFGIHIYLHRFVAEDCREDLHDHPWSAVSIVINGGYREVRGYLDGDVGVRTKGRPVVLFNIIRPHTMHRISAARPETWTLFFRGSRRKGWGFFYQQWAKKDVRYVPVERNRQGWWLTAPNGVATDRQPFDKAGAA